MNEETRKFVDECEVRCNKATKGPIEVHRYDNEGGDIQWQMQQRDGSAIVLCAFADLDNRRARHDAAFYAHAREDLPKALRIIREQEAEIQRLREELAPKTTATVQDSATLCLCPAMSEYDPHCPKHGVVGIGVVGG